MFCGRNSFINPGDFLLSVVSISSRVSGVMQERPQALMLMYYLAYASYELSRKKSQLSSSERDSGRCGLRAFWIYKIISWRRTLRSQGTPDEWRVCPHTYTNTQSPQPSQLHHPGQKAHFEHLDNNPYLETLILRRWKSFAVTGSI